MNWKDKTVVRILLLVAEMLSGDWRGEIKSLATHISVNAPKEGE